MPLVDLSKTGEKKKLIWAAALGFVAILFLWWTLIGFNSGTRTVAKSTATPTPQKTAQTTPKSNGTVSQEVKNFEAYTEVRYETASYNAPEAKRNIFAYYEPPPKPVAAPSTPTPTPEPPPPVLLASLSPSNVFARTEDFKLEVAGDKFTPDQRIFIDGRELPTSYKSPQQLSTTVSASFITSPGARQVVVRTPDNRLFSNQLTINVAAPPTPNYTYIGIISPANRVDEIALIQERSSRNIINAHRGEVLGGRFRVTSISEKEVVMVDTSLKIKHTIPMSEGDKAAGPLARPTPRVDAEDDEP